MGVGSRCRAVAVLLALLPVLSAAGGADARVAAAEQLYADWLDASYALLSIAAGPMQAVAARDRTAWQALKTEREAALGPALAALKDARLGREDSRAVARMQSTLDEPPTDPVAAAPGESQARCAAAGDATLGRAALSGALYACFEHFGNHIAFEGRSIARATALELLQQLDTSARRRALFEALGPLWQRINGADESQSPYRRLIRLAAAENGRKGTSPISEAARTVGTSVAVAERWLIEVLDAWRRANPGPALEPWDYWRTYAGGVAALDALTPPERVLPLSRAFYRDLGADLDALGVVHDLEVRPGKAPLAYEDAVQIGRPGPKGWRRAISRVSANVEHGGLFVLNEIVHEDGHAVHMQAVRTRPAFFGLGDDLFLEAFADVSSWSVLEPRWQQRYLGRGVDEQTALRALYGNVMLDVAWGLFELRMLKDPDADPNGVWTEITARYLNVRPHPELSWWALRVQLVDEPGYLINYGLGAILTAELRGQVRAAIGDFDAGNPRWYAYLSRALLRFGYSVETPELLRRFLGRPVSDAALLGALGRIAPPAPPAPPAQR
jgi:hypothetical protein